MSNYQAYNSGNAPPSDTSNNPWAEQSGNTPHQSNPFQHQERHQPDLQYSNQDYLSQQYSSPPGPPPGQQLQENPWDDGQPRQDYSAPSGPPPARQYQQPQQQYSSPAPGLPPRRAGTFDDQSIVPESERGEQREAMEQFEMTNSRHLSQDDQNIETLQKQFRKLDGALVAAIYGDSKDMGATREMLGELAQDS